MLNEGGHIGLHGGPLVFSKGGASMVKFCFTAVKCDKSQHFHKLSRKLSLVMGSVGLWVTSVIASHSMQYPSRVTRSWAGLVEVISIGSPHNAHFIVTHPSALDSLHHRT